MSSSWQNHTNMEFNFSSHPPFPLPYSLSLFSFLYSTEVPFTQHLFIFDCRIKIMKALHSLVLSMVIPKNRKRGSVAGGWWARRSEAEMELRGRQVPDQGRTSPFTEYPSNPGSLLGRGVSQHELFILKVLFVFWADEDTKLEWRRQVRSCCRTKRDKHLKLHGKDRDLDRVQIYFAN